MNAPGGKVIRGTSSHTLLRPQAFTDQPVCGIEIKFLCDENAHKADNYDKSFYFGSLAIFSAGLCFR